MPISRDDEEERAARISLILEELRLNTEDLHELTKQSQKRAREVRRESQNTVATVRQRRAVRKAGKKR